MEINAQPSSLIRIVAAILYDLFVLILGIFMVVGFAVLPIYQAITGENAIDSGQAFFQILLLVVTFLYYCLSWKIGGQTIGMKAWRLALVPSDGTKTLHWSMLIKRFLIAPLSAVLLFSGFLLILFHPQKRSAHDIASKTHLVHIPKK